MDRDIFAERAPAALFLDGSLPRKMTMVSLSGTRLLGEPRQCEETESLSLGFPGMSEAEIEALLAPVCAVETLSLDKTAVGDALVRRLAGRFDLHRINVRDTLVTAQALRDLRAEQPRLRTQPAPPSA
jgi:hypothetical protein